MSGRVTLASQNPCKCLKEKARETDSQLVINCFRPIGRSDRLSAPLGSRGAVDGFFSLSRGEK